MGLEHTLISEVKWLRCRLLSDINLGRNPTENVQLAVADNLDSFGARNKVDLAHVELLQSRSSGQTDISATVRESSEDRLAWKRLAVTSGNRDVDFLSVPV